MVLGAVASTLVETAHPETANQIVQKIEDALGVHGEISYLWNIFQDAQLHVDIVPKLFYIYITIDQNYYT